MVKIAKKVVEDVIPKPWDEKELQQNVLKLLLKKVGRTPGLVCPFYRAVYVNKGNLSAYQLVYDEKNSEFPCCEISNSFESKQIKKCQWIRPLGTSFVDEDGVKYYQCDNAIYRHFLDGKNVAIVKKGDSNKILHKWLFLFQIIFYFLYCR